MLRACHPAGPPGNWTVRTTHPRDRAGWSAEQAGLGRTEPVMRLSARNKINATVTGITHGEATANIELDAAGTRLVASSTVEAANELGLQPGMPVIAIVKASDVILAVTD